MLRAGKASQLGSLGLLGLLRMALAHARKQQDTYFPGQDVQGNGSCYT